MTPQQAEKLNRQDWRRRGEIKAAAAALWPEICLE
jgi:hypothetical protein